MSYYAKDRAKSTSITLNEREVAEVKAMMIRGDAQHNIAAWYGVNGGRIGEISHKKKHADVAPCDPSELPPMIAVAMPKREMYRRLVEFGEF